jgi:hypothetical protein
MNGKPIFKTHYHPKQGQKTQERFHPQKDENVLVLWRQI